ncbi:glucoamylase family protein [Gracilimonas sp.]|uniref:glucoamylase family protein n=1 Tax=Gracilimonas sp. TaxID=1974203 RepID=UPI0025BC046E|nr:glucoamylase family protein [Gracilimonas sp.]
MRNKVHIRIAYFKNTCMILYGLIMLLLFTACDQNNAGQNSDVFQLLKVSADNVTLSSGQTVKNISVTATFRIEFSASADTVSAKNSIQLINSDEEELPLEYKFENNLRDIVVRGIQPLKWKTSYQLVISNTLESGQGADFPGIEYSFETINGQLELVSASLNEIDLTSSGQKRDIQFDDIQLEFTFSEELDEQNYQNYFNISPSFSKNLTLSPDSQTVTVTNTEPLDYYRHYSININSSLSAANGFEFDGFERTFQTGLDPSPKFPSITDEQLLTKVQEATFQYFWDFGHPVSGLARERNTSGETVTTGGSGFGLMAIITGIHRGFITRNEGITRIQKIVDFLATADRFHGAWSHWLNGSTGDAIAFSTYDDGGDLVETAFMAQGLITVRQFLDENIAAESELINDINLLLNTIEWDWYTREGQNVLYWHWSPNHGWEMNMKIKGYNEALIVYVLAASSGNYGIAPEVYHQGWASSGNIINGNSFYGITLPLGYDYGGPLFFSHYSFLGLDPRNLSDTYADYWQQNRNHTLINREHNIINPNNFVGYSSDSWGLTASDNPFGYLAHEPTRDNGTITPTAAISSIPYTPTESMEAMRHFYFILGDKLWGEYGFHDAFNPTEGWWADSYLAIDQGPIIIMIENYRSGLLWDLFMTAPEVQNALSQLDFSVGEQF